MDWKRNIEEMLADKLEEQMIANIRAGFISTGEILERCGEYI